MKSLAVAALVLVPLAAHAGGTSTTRPCSIKVTGTPHDARVFVTGPDGFGGMGGMPWQVEGIKAGTYQVKVTRDGYKEDVRRVELKNGGTAVIQVALRPTGPFLGSGGLGTGLEVALGTERAQEKPIECTDLGRSQTTTVPVVPGVVHVVGGLTADEVDRIIRRHWAEIRYCYAKTLATEPGVAGKVNVYFQVSAMGEVVTARVQESDFTNVGLDECILTNVRRWNFPNPRGEGLVEVTCPFIFQQTK